MALPRVVLRGRKIILLSGFKNGPKEKNKPDALVVDADALNAVAEWLKASPACASPRSGIPMPWLSGTSLVNGSRRLEVPR